MDIKDILHFGMLIEADIYVDGIGTTHEDGNLYMEAIKKWYHVTDDTPNEMAKRYDKEIEERIRELVKLSRREIEKYVNG